MKMPLLLTAASSRAMALAAVRSGYTAICADNFMDSDTTAAAVHSIPLAADDPERSLYHMDTIRRRYGKCHVVVGGGLEREAHLTAKLAGDACWLGAHPDARRELDDPVSLYSLLRRHGVGMPATSSIAPCLPAAGGAASWLRKARSGSGGYDVLKTFSNNELSNKFNVNNNYCWQQYRLGESWSALFLATRRRVKILGFSRHLPQAPDNTDFRFRGAVSASPQPGWRQELEQLLNSIAPGYGLIGLGGVDFIAAPGSSGAISVIEINPRPPSVISLHERPPGLMALHVAACSGEDQDYEDAQPGARGEMVYYAGEYLESSSSEPVLWPRWIADRPRAGSRFAPGEPVCTVLASGRDHDAVVKKLGMRFRKLSTLLKSKSQQMVARRLYG